MSIKESLKATKAYSTFLKMHRLHEIRILFGERYKFFKEARSRFASEKPKRGSFNDYKKAFWKHRVTYSEYMYSYEYWHLNEQERDEFISTSEMQVIYRKLGEPEVRDLFHDKVRFLTAFSPYVHRWWALAKSLTFEAFKAKALEFDLIAKPIDGTRGDGIFKIVGNQVEDWRQLYDRLVEDNYLLEQCIVACNELAAFHPSSLNTIRVVTISNVDRCEVFGALFRMGAHGSVIDNTHAGGVYAPINVVTGTIDISAIDAHNNHYDAHPDTGKQIKGFHIPEWERIMTTCKEASRAIPDIHFAGWDLCVNRAGQVEIIEGNHAPDFDGGMQAPLKIGVKKKLQQTIMDVMGKDPIDHISVWK
jgi:glutathione synthase/RimK-type ligase-like ATP-grasp enzyme